MTPGMLCSSRAACARGLLVLGFLASVTAQDLVINEVVTQNGRSNIDEDGDASDWVEILNRGAATADLDGWSLSDEPDDSAKWILPSLRLGPGERLLVWCSGKDRIHPPEEAIERPDTAVSFAPMFVEENALFRYLHGKQGDPAPPANWAELEFEDAMWLSGQGGIGYGIASLSTQVPEGTTAIFIRREFSVSEDKPGTLVLRLSFDDGFIAFLNGSLIAFESVDSEEVLGFSNRATRLGSFGPRKLIDVSRAATLRPGRNVLAVAVLNATPSSNDLGIAIELGAVAPILHASFQIDREGESLILSHPDGTVADQLDVPALGRDRAVGRLPDGAGQFGYLAWPTPGAPNEGFSFLEPVPDDAAVGPPPGRHAGPLVVRAEIGFEAPLELRFTLDGSMPTTASPALAGPIALDRSSSLRIAGFLDGRNVLRGAGRSYLLGEPALTLPILAVSLSPLEFRTLGSRTSGDRESECWLEVMDPSGRVIVSEGAGLRAHGRSLRLEFGKKSYRMHFREAYGAGRLRQSLFEGSSEHNAIVIRARGIRRGSQYVQSPTLFEDQLLRAFASRLQPIALHGGWYHLYVNGAYEGLYNVLDRLDEELLAAKTGTEGWDIIKGEGEVHGGDGSAWTDLLGIARGDGLTELERVAELKRRIEIEDFSRFLALQAWFGNADLGTNWYAVKPAGEASQWRFVVWDGDRIGGLAPEASILATWTTGPMLALRALLPDPEFQEALISSLESAVRDVLRSESVLREIGAIRARLEPDIPIEAARNGGSLEEWLEAVGRLEEFCRGRDEAILDAALRSNRLSIPRALEVVPRRVIRREGAQLRVRVMGFSTASKVLIDGREVPHSKTVSSTEIEVSLPDPTSLSANPSIRTEGEDGFGVTRHGLLEIVEGGYGFIRGDGNADGRLTIADAVLAVLGASGAGTPQARCPAADADANGRVDLADPLWILRYLFLNGPPLPAPFPLCGLLADMDEDCGGECLE